MYYQSLFIHQLCYFLISLIVAQNTIPGFEQYNSYPLSVYIDNLPNNIRSESLNRFYYSKLKQSDYIIVQTIDNESKKRELHIKSKRAKNGFLFVNTCIQQRVIPILDNTEQITLNYVVNNKIVNSYEEVMELINLRKRKIIGPIRIDKQNNVITVYISR